ncbi:kinase-like protein [Atractiella rhizophila]|nr:kinase-like protein [Atractiella rhizophila]
MRKEGVVANGVVGLTEDVEMEDEGEEEEEGEDDEFDMFADEVKPKKKVGGKRKNGIVPVIDRAAHATGIQDDFDDSEGYYRVLIGELLDDGRYHVHASLGKGMFSGVVRARDTQNGNKEVAIKVIRSQESMYKAGQKEANILKKLMDADPADKKHVIRLERSFEHRGHLCLVFESLSMNLREVVKRFGKDVGLNLRAVRAYAHQLFLALSLLKKCNIMHADIKPDNILVNENKSALKLCDLGSASDVIENEITPYLVSRFYRAPEIILGLPYDPAIDVWSIGCTLYELYSGKILFPGRNNNHMLQLHMELKGRFNTKLLKKAQFVDQHFDDQMNFIGAVRDKITGSENVQKMTFTKPTLDVRGRLMQSSQTRKLNPTDIQMLSSFCDLIEKTLTLEASKRITPKEALSHPFIRGL